MTDLLSSFPRKRVTDLLSSFPRKRESRPGIWIPAFAGMTAFEADEKCRLQREQVLNQIRLLPIAEVEVEVLIVPLHYVRERG